MWFAMARRESERSWHEGSGKRGDGELYEEACSRPCEHCARFDRCSLDCSKRVVNTTTGVVNMADSVSTLWRVLGQEELSWL